MPNRKRDRDSLRAVCEQLFPDDGVNPKDQKRGELRKVSKPDRKLFQLCRQVARAVELGIGGLPQADALIGVTVHCVTPAPNASRLMVTAEVTDESQRLVAKSALDAYSGRLRADVASAITRKRAPELVFNVICKGDEYGQ